MKSASLFTGGAIWDIGAMMAGLTPVWGVEIVPEIADVAERNIPGLSVIRSDVAAVDYATLEKVDHLHVSPSCKNASNAKSDATEAQEDIEAAKAICWALIEIEPVFFTLENVYAYRDFKAFKRILHTLHQLGYAFDYWHLNSADYGGWVLCPIHDNVSYVENHWGRETAPDIVKASAMMQPEDQARILAWDAVANLDKATQQAIAESAIWQKMESAHSLEKLILTGGVDALLTTGAMSKSGSMDGIDGSIGWLLNVCLGESSLKERWSTTLMETKRITVLKILKCFLATANIWSTTTNKTERTGCPLCRFTAVPQTRKRLILIARRDGKPVTMPRPTHAENPPPQLDMFGGEFGLKRWVGWYEAISDLVEELPDSEFAPWQLERLPEELKTMLVGVGGYDGAIVTGNSDEPSFAVTATMSRQVVRAFLAPINGEGVSGFYDNEPAQTIAANHSSNKYRAFIFPGDNSGNGVIRQADEPMNTVQTRTPEQCPHRAFVGRVVKMTPRALARFQSIPDDYELPKQNGLACTIIGNGVPSLLAKAICEALK